MRNLRQNLLKNKNVNKLRNFYIFVSKRWPKVGKVIRKCLINPLFYSRRTFFEFLGLGGKFRSSEKMTIYLEVSGVSDSQYKDGIRNVSKYFVDNFTMFDSLGYRLVLVEGIAKTFYVSNFFWDSEKGDFGKRSTWKPRKTWNPLRSDFLIFLTFQSFATQNSLLFSSLDKQVRVATFVYDTLPIQLPEYFTNDAVDSFVQSLRIAAGISEIIFVNSNVEKDELRKVLSRLAPSIESRIQIESISLKSVPLYKSRYQKDFNSQSEARINFTNPDWPQIVAISTIEPRKGYDELISSAVEAWKKNSNFNLVLLGRLGWVGKCFIEDFENFLQDYRGKVIWIPDSQDFQLLSILQNSNVLIAPSRAEGFGLSIVDAAINGVPILARDIPVNREIHGDYVEFFGEQEQSLNLSESLIGIDKVIINAKMRLENFKFPAYEESFVQLITKLINFYDS